MSFCLKSLFAPKAIFYLLYSFMQPHLKITKEQISEYVLLPGDPGRVAVIGKFLSNFQMLSSNREFTIGTGEYKGKRITVCSTGIGCPSTAIAVEELIAAGAKYLLRVGTCGGAWRSDIPAGSVIIPTATIRDEGTTVEYIPKEFPAVADYSLVTTLVQAAEQKQQQYFVGINRTHDAFYGNQNAITKWGKYLLEEKWKNNETPILSSEMECAALFVIASLRGVKAGAILAVNSEPESLKERIQGNQLAVQTETSIDITERTVSSLIQIALEGIYLLV